MQHSSHGSPGAHAPGEAGAFGRWLGREIAASGLSQNAWSRRSGIPKTAISGYVHATRYPEPRVLARLLRQFTPEKAEEAVRVLEAERRAKAQADLAREQRGPTLEDRVVERVLERLAVQITREIAVTLAPILAAHARRAYAELVAQENARHVRPAPPPRRAPAEIAFDDAAS